MYRPSYEPPSTSPQPNQRYFSLNRINLDTDMKNLFNTQDYYAGQGSGGNQELHTGQDYSMVKARLTVQLPLNTTLRSNRWWRPLKLKRKGLFLKVIDYFEKETGSQSRGYDAIVSKWKNRVLPRIGAFCDIFDNVQQRIETMLANLKDHSAWKQVEMPLFYSKQNPGSKKAKTSETTSGSTQGGLNLNKEADGSREEVPEVRPIGQDRAKKKASSSSHSESSFVVGGGLVDLVTDKWKSLKLLGYGKKKEQQQSYIDLKNQELDIEEKASREATELKRQKLEIKRKTLELKLRNKRDKDLRFYMKRIDETLPPIQQGKLMDMKQEIKELYDLDY
ncbi:hypothetical protein Tco_0526398 [Tanacetum coccineum]